MFARVRNPIRTLAVACVVLAAAAPAGAGLEDQARSAAASSTFNDAAGDAGAAPDITEVVVSNDAAGTVTMSIAVPGRPQLGFEEAMGVWINADRSEATGRFGDDYRLLKFAFGSVFERWDGSDWQLFSPASLIVRWEGGRLVIIAGRADLGIADAFDFQAGAVLFAGDDPDGWPSDEAPDFGYWTYQLVFAPTLGAAKVLPARPKAGRLVSVAVPVLSGGKPVDTGTVKCAASIGTKRLTASTSGLNAGTAGCAWKLPAAAAGKTLRASVTVTTAGGTATKAFSVKVR